MIISRRQSPFLPLGVALSLAMVWLAWTSFSISKAGVDVNWSGMVAALVCFAVLFGIQQLVDKRIKARLNRDDRQLAALILKAAKEFEEGRIGLRRASGGLRVMGRGLFGLGVVFVVGAVLGEALVISHSAKHFTSGDFIGMCLFFAL